MLRDSNKMKYYSFFCAKMTRDIKNKKMDANTEKN